MAGGKLKLVNTRSVFGISLVVMTLTILAVWILGLGQHQTLYHNSLLSTSILSLAFFLFILIGLYRGFKLKDDIGKISSDIKIRKPGWNAPSSGGVDIPASDAPDVPGDGLEAIAVGLLIWLGVTVLFFLFTWVFGTVFWAMLLMFMAMLYWIFFRALRFVFRNSRRCKGHMGKSAVYAILYTVLYNCWIYGIIMLMHYLV